MCVCVCKLVCVCLSTVQLRVPNGATSKSSLPTFPGRGAVHTAVAVYLGSVVRYPEAHLAGVHHAVGCVVERGQRASGKYGCQMPEKCICMRNIQFSGETLVYNVT